MGQTVRLSICLWCGVCLGGITQAQPPRMYSPDQSGLLNGSAAAHVGLLSPETHQHLLTMLGEPVLNIIDATHVTFAAGTGPISNDLASWVTTQTTAPQRIPEPGMLTLLVLGGAALLAGRRARSGGTTKAASGNHCDR